MTAEDDAAQAYRDVLSRFGQVVDFDISGLDRLGVPVTSCSLLVDGVTRHHGNGYGATAASAELSGLGELAEGVLAAAHLAALRTRARQGSYRELVTTEGADRVADPRTLCLPAGSPYAPSMPLSWVPLERCRTGETVWVPLDLVASDAAELDGPGLVVPVTNGLGAGLDPDRPVAHGIGEILQRHTNGLRFRALDTRSPEIKPERLPPGVHELLDRFRSEGVQPVLKHAGTAYGACSTYVMGLDDDDLAPIRLTACGEAADPSAERSVVKAVLEYANSRARKAFCFGDRTAAQAVAPPAYWNGLADHPGEARAVAAMRAWAELPVHTLRELTAPDRSRTVSYGEITGTTGPPVTGNPTEQLTTLLEGVAGYDVLTARSEVGGVVVAKTIVVGLEVETLSYGRIGELNTRELIEADLGVVHLGDAATPTHPDRIVLSSEAEERLGGPAWYSYAAAADLIGPLYPLYREPPRHSVQV